jgi:glutamate-5-semialdehyde dehydrogenase
MESKIIESLQSLKVASKRLGRLSGEARNRGLLSVSEALRKNADAILTSNNIDLDAAKKTGMKDSLLERLSLSGKKIDAMADGIANIAHCPEPLGKVLDGWTLANGLAIEKVTVPLGVAAIIYESRPNVTADAWALAYKVGCAILLRGSSAALNSNKKIVGIIKNALIGAGGAADALELAPGGGHGEIDEILCARTLVDVVLPRGGKALIQHCVQNAKVPVIETGEGNCHIFVDGSAVLDSASDVVYNAKVQRPGACNAVETVLVHEKIAAEFIPLLVKKLAGIVELRLDAKAKNALLDMDALQKNVVIKDATEVDWETEFLDFVLAVKTVANIDEALAHIEKYSTRHSDAILTNDIKNAERFLNEVDSACVYLNASTRFTDGGEFGFGAELGISTQKFHARGPMGLSALTTYKYKIKGDYNTRGA